MRDFDGHRAPRVEINSTKDRNRAAARNYFLHEVLIEFVARVDWSSHQSVLVKTGMSLIVLESQYRPSAVLGSPEGFNAERP